MLHPVLRLVALLLLAGIGCQSSSPPVEEVLSSSLDVAHKEWNGVLLEFGLPSALPWLDEGWSYGEIGAEGNPMRWAVSERAGFRFWSNREGRLLAFFECEPFLFERSPTQFIGPSVNGTDLAPIELRPGRERYPVELPVVAGENHVTLRFRYAGAPARTSADRRRLAVAFYRFELGFDGDAPVAGRPGPFSRKTADDGTPYVFLPPESALTIFRRDASPSTLRLALGAQSPVSMRAPAGSRLRLVVASGDGEIHRRELEADGGRTLWEESLPAVAGPHAVTLQAVGAPLFVHAELHAAGSDVPVRPRPPGLDQRNIVVVVLDGANALRTGLYGHERETTPVLDELGRESVVFDVAVAQAVYTIASIGSLLTGQYPERHQNVTFADRLRDDVTTLPALLGSAGYRTAAFSGNAVVSSNFGLDRGYEEFHAIWKRDDYTGHGDSVLDAFLRRLDALEDERFFAYVHFREPHFPYNPPAPFDTYFGPPAPFPEGLADAEAVERLNRRVAEGEPLDERLLQRVVGLYEGNLAYVDALLGGIVDALRQRELLEETVLVVTADHGEALFEHGFLGHNVQLYEESIRIPLVLRIPGVQPRRVAGVVELLDLTPTLLDLAGLSAHPAVAAMQGESLLPVALGAEGAAGELAFSRTVWDKPRYSVRAERFKLIWDSRTGVSELYDLEEDPLEERDLAGRRPLVEGYLRQSLFRWYREQERLRAGEPPPAEAALSEDERRVIDSLGYASHTRPEKR